MQSFRTFLSKNHGPFLPLIALAFAGIALYLMIGISLKESPEASSVEYVLPAIAFLLAVGFALMSANGGHHRDEALALRLDLQKTFLGFEVVTMNIYAPIRTIYYEFCPSGLRVVVNVKPFGRAATTQFDSIVSYSDIEYLEVQKGVFIESVSFVFKSSANLDFDQSRFSSSFMYDKSKTRHEALRLASEHKVESRLVRATRGVKNTVQVVLSLVVSLVLLLILRIAFS